MDAIKLMIQIMAAFLIVDVIKRRIEKKKEAKED